MKPKICIVGPGVVGQATGKAFVKLGFETVFLGGNGGKTQKLRDEGYTAYTREDLFDSSYDFDISMLTVPTPTVKGRVDIDPITSASVDLGKRLRLSNKDYHVVVVKSTVPPGTTEDVVATMVEKYSGRKRGHGFGLCMNPEYLREQTAYEDAVNPRIILIGQYDERSGDMLEHVYKNFKCPILRCTIKEAEFQKYVHNLFNSTKITFFNEMRQLAKLVGLDTQKVFEITARSAEGMWNPDYGIRDFGPFSGSCLPKDTQAFLSWAKQYHADLHLLRTTIYVNEHIAKGRENINRDVIGADL